MSFKDHFSGHADDYRRFRPIYPDALFEYLAGLAPKRQRAWDCGTGNGQAAAALATYFREVIATDASAEQIARARGPDNVRFRIAPAEASGIPAESVDLITVAQAFHWFDHRRFLGEADRVLRPGGALALWTYGVMHIDPEVDGIVHRYYRETVGPYWPPERAQVDAGYADAALPFEELDTPAFAMTAHWTLDSVLGYLRTWSATQNYIRETGEDPTEALGARLRDVWQDPGSERRVGWPLRMRVVRKPRERGTPSVPRQPGAVPTGR
ncbi:class I SAM-dependent methyltransferase [Ectothiorhodospiraceae bacterium WFHF3C12]|nr:class I SAM-dependent methyltransferase [Ectothiorhodospiraceae bacterium WFHF3C12]